MTFVHDIPALTTHHSDAEARAARILGKAINQNALRRLFEFWPEAEVEVYYGRYDDRRTTTVVIRRDAELVAPCKYGKAYCSPSDKFIRQVGLRIAFRRALDGVRAQPLVAYGSPRRA